MTTTSPSTTPTPVPSSSGSAGNEPDAPHPPAYRTWHCGTCHYELVAHGNDGDLTCETCGRIYRPDAEKGLAPCIDAGDGQGLDEL